MHNAFLVSKLSAYTGAVIRFMHHILLNIATCLFISLFPFYIFLFIMFPLSQNIYPFPYLLITHLGPAQISEAPLQTIFFSFLLGFHTAFKICIQQSVWVLLTGNIY